MAGWHRRGVPAGLFHAGGRGAGLGPAIAFLYSGPAINVLAIVLTARSNWAAYPHEGPVPAEAYWETFFAADEAMARLCGPTAIRDDCIEFGCGSGTVTVPAARRTTGP